MVDKEKEIRLDKDYGSSMISSKRENYVSPHLQSRLETVKEVVNENL